MHYRLLGQTGLRVSEIGFGCASYWGKKIFNDADAIRLVHTAVDNGVTFLDTGSSYSDGNAEPRLGRALASLPKRHDLVVATKAGTYLKAWNRPDKDFRAKSVRQSIEASLRRLQLDAIPLLQLHGPQIFDISDELIETLQRMKAEGKIRHLGVNSFDMKVVTHLMTLNLFEVMMIDYNILRPERDAIIKKLAEQKIGVLAGMALAGGLYRKEFHIRRLRDIWYMARARRNHAGDVLRGERFDFVNDQPGWTGGQIALGWVLRNADVSCAVFGTTRMQHLLDNLQASGKILDDGIVREIAAAQTT